MSQSHSKNPPTPSASYQRLLVWLPSYPDGAPLPSEELLQSKLKLTAAELRSALERAQAEGLVSRDRTSGAFVTRQLPLTEKLLAASDRIDIPALVDRSTLIDSAQTRLLIEPKIASLAAARRTDSELKELRLVANSLREVKTWHQYAELDAVFHNSIGDMCRNPLLAELLAVAITVHFALSWEHFDAEGPGPSANVLAFTEHDAIIEAIEKRDGRYAAEAARKHLLSSSARFAEYLGEP